MRRPWIKDAQTAKWVGLALFAIAVFILYDAYERRGGRTPAILRPILPI